MTEQSAMTKALATAPMRLYAVKAGEAWDRQSASAVESLARRMAETGAVAFSHTGEPTTGEFEDAVILRTFGEVPSANALLIGIRR